MHLLQPPEYEAEEYVSHTYSPITALKSLLTFGLAGRGDAPMSTTRQIGRVTIRDAIISDHSGTLRLGEKVDELWIGNYHLKGVTPYRVNGNKSVWHCAIDHFELTDK